MDVLGLGQYIRKQRESSRLSLRSLAGLTGISGPYLSQVERGLRKPSAEILQGIAKGLRVSAETLYVQAGILEDRPVPDVVSTIMGDPSITEKQKQALVQIYEAFREETGRSATEAAPADRTAPTGKSTRTSPRAPRTAPKARSPRTTSRTTSRASSRTTKEV
jgi:transcriptional regulator with XRE-family HTH domain